jgi:hypothetical protein
MFSFTKFLKDKVNVYEKQMNIQQLWKTFSRNKTQTQKQQKNMA